MKGETVTIFRQFNCRCLPALRNDFILMNIDSCDLRLLTRFSIRMLSCSLVVLKLLLLYNKRLFQGRKLY